MNHFMNEQASSTTLEKFRSQGHEILPAVLSPQTRERWITDLNERLGADSEGAIRGKSRRIVGGRNLQSCWDGWREVIQRGPVAAFLRSELGGSFGLVRILYFDKPPGQSWNLALHRDRTIAVSQHHAPAAPYGKPTTKAGVCHVEADLPLLSRMVTLRFHLDAMHCDNGPLIVVSNSHADPECASSGSDSTEIHCDAGDVFAMKPLLLHGSRSSVDGCTDHRRVVHLEFAPQDGLAQPYQWHHYDPAEAMD